MGDIPSADTVSGVGSVTAAKVAEVIGTVAIPVATGASRYRVIATTFQSGTVSALLTNLILTSGAVTKGKLLSTTSVTQQVFESITPPEGATDISVKAVAEFAAGVIANVHLAVTRMD